MFDTFGYHDKRENVYPQVPDGCEPRLTIIPQAIAITRQRGSEMRHYARLSWSDLRGRRAISTRTGSSQLFDNRPCGQAAQWSECSEWL